MMRKKNSQVWQYICCIYIFMHKKIICMLSATSSDRKNACMPLFSFSF